MPEIIKINELDINTGNYNTVLFSVPYSVEGKREKRVNINVGIKGTSADDKLANFKLLINELYKIKNESKDCILEVKSDTTHSTFFEILSYEILMENLDLINIDLFVDNFGYSELLNKGDSDTPHATKTLPNYFDILAIKGDVPAFTQFFMKLLSAEDIYNIYYGFKSEKLISDIANFEPILEAESQTLTNMTLTADGDCRDSKKAYSDATYPTSDWTTYIKFSLNNAHYKGRYLVLARCESESADDDVIKIRLKCGSLYNDLYSFKEEDANLWRLIELGEIQVPYSETQATNSDYEIQLIGNGSDRIGIDYIVLIPIDESFGIRKSELNTISQNEIYEIDTIKKIFSTYLQNINDNNSYNRGNFVYLPKGKVRIVVVSDAIDENKITDQMAFYLNYRARYKFLRSD